MFFHPFSVFLPCSSVVFLFVVLHSSIVPSSTSQSRSCIIMCISNKKVFQEVLIRHTRSVQFPSCTVVADAKRQVKSNKKFGPSLSLACAKNRTYYRQLLLVVMSSSTLMAGWLMNAITIYCNGILSITSILCILFYLGVKRESQYTLLEYFGELDLSPVPNNLSKLLFPIFHY